MLPWLICNSVSTTLTSRLKWPLLDQASCQAICVCADRFSWLPTCLSAASVQYVGHPETTTPVCPNILCFGIKLYSFCSSHLHFGSGKFNADVTLISKCPKFRTANRNAIGCRCVFKKPRSLFACLTVRICNMMPQKKPRKETRIYSNITEKV
jgi:hypothetical protein